MVDPGSLAVLRAQDAEQERAVLAQERSRCSLSPELEQDPKAVPRDTDPPLHCHVSHLLFPSIIMFYREINSAFLKRECFHTPASHL